VTVRYRIDIEDHTGSVVAVFQDFLNLSFSAKISNRGNYTLRISGFDSRKSLFGDDYLIRVWMDDTSEGIRWTNVFTGIHKSYVDALSENGQRTFTSYGPSLEEIIDKAEILYPAGSSGAAKSGIASTVMYEYVDENAGTNATTGNGRDDDHTNPITNAPDLAQGPTWDGSEPYSSLLTVLRKIRQYSIDQGDQVDFRVNYLGGYTFQFQAGAIGTDRTATGLSPTSNGLNGAGNVPVIFSAIYGNVMTFSKSESRMSESNAVTALGQGDKAKRARYTALDALSIAKSPIAKRELTINATNIPYSDVPGLIAVAQTKLDDKKASEKFSFTPKKGAQILFRDYFLGDFVTGEDPDGGRLNKQITEINVNVSPTENALIERISIKFEDS